MFPELELWAELNSTETARKISSLLPLSSRVNRWGEEIYFEIPLQEKLDPTARAEVEIGELGYWPEGRAFCIFFGPTPISQDEKPRAYSEVNIIGKLLEVPREKLNAIKPGARVRIESGETKIKEKA